MTVQKLIDLLQKTNALDCEVRFTDGTGEEYIIKIYLDGGVVWLESPTEEDDGAE